MDLNWGRDDQKYMHAALGISWKERPGMIWHNKGQLRIKTKITGS